MIAATDLLAAIRHRIGLVLLVGLATFVLIMTIAMLQPRGYTASSFLLIDLTQPDPEANSQTASPAVVETIIGTQMGIIRSDAVLRDVAQRDPSFATLRAKNPGQEGLQSALDRIRENLHLEVEKGSNLISMQYTARTPTDAARVVNAIGDVYLNRQLAVRTASFQKEIAEYSVQLRDARAQLEAKQRALSAFEQQNGIVGISRDLEGDRARNLSVALVQAEADAAQAQGRAGAASDPSVLQSDVVQNLSRTLGEETSRVALLGRQLGSDHPTMKAAEAQLSSLRSSLSAAKAAQASGLSSASVSANRRVASINSTLNQQQRRLIGLASVQDRLSVLQNDLEGAQETQAQVRRRLSEAEIRQKVSLATASRLDRATPPTAPSKPVMLLWTLAGLIMAIGTSLVSAGTLEALRPRIRTAKGTARSLQVDVICDMTKPRQLTQSSWSLTDRRVQS